MRGSRRLLLAIAARGRAPDARARPRTRAGCAPTGGRRPRARPARRRRPFGMLRNDSAASASPRLTHDDQRPLAAPVGEQRQRVLRLRRRRTSRRRRRRSSRRARAAESADAQRGLAGGLAVDLDGVAARASARRRAPPPRELRRADRALAGAAGALLALRLGAAAANLAARLGRVRALRGARRPRP